MNKTTYRDKAVSVKRKINERAMVALRELVNKSTYYDIAVSV